MAQPRSFSPADTPATVRTDTLRSSTVRIGARGLQLLFGTASGMLLARLLTPGDFGLFAMVGSLTAFVGSFRDFGLPMATVYQDQIDDDHLSALFWLNLRWNAVIGVFMLLMAPVLAWFYGEERLVAITLVMALGIAGLGLSVQHESILTRQMRFGTLAAIETGALLASVVVALALALLGAGYWALVGQFLANNVVRSAATWWAGRWRPGRMRRDGRAAFEHLPALLAYSKDVTIFRVISHAGRNLDRVLVGALSGPTAMGLYDRSYQWSLFPLNQVYGTLLSVAVAGLSRTRHDAEAYRAQCRRALLPVWVLCLPASAFMVVEPRATILLLLGSQWLDAVPMFHLLSIAAFVTTISTVTKALYLSQGSTKRQLRWGVISTPIMIAAVSIGSMWGAYGVAWGFTIGTCVLAYPTIAFCLHGSLLDMRAFWGIAAPPAAAAVAAAGALAAGNMLVPFGGSFAATFALKLLLFGAVYALVWVLLPGGRRTLREAIKGLQTLRPNKNTSFS